MHTQWKVQGSLGVVLTSTILLAGCGGGGGNNTTSTAQSSGTTITGAIAVTSSSSANRILSFSTSTPATTTATTITGLGTGETVVGADVRPADGNLYVLTSASKIYTVNTSTGAATQRSTLTTTLSGTTFGVDFNSVVDLLRVVSNTGQNLAVQVDTGSTTVQTTLTSGTQATPQTPITNIGTVSYTQSFSAACRTAATLFDTTTGTFYSGNLGLGQVTAIGSLGVTPSSTFAGYQIATSNSGTDTAFALVQVSGTYNLYSVNLSTGAVSNAQALGGLNAGETVMSLVMPLPTTQPTQSVGQMLGLTTANTLVSFNANAPSKICTSATITGLATNDSLIGIDIRPANGQVYGIATPSGNIYTINSTSGAATQTATISGATLSGQNFGVSINPIANAARVVSDTNQNLVVNLDTGATTTATSLTGVTNAVVSSLEYTNSFAGTNTIKAYVLDSAGNQLLQLGKNSGSAQNGDLSVVGSTLGTDISAIGQIAINPVNNLAYAAINSPGTTSSQFIQLNLSTGAQTTVGTIGGSQVVRGLTFSSVPTATVYAATTTNQLLTFTPTTPSAPSATTTISGLTSGETLVGLDFRPFNGLLYGFTSNGTGSGSVYTINTSTGAATKISTLSGTALNGTKFSQDFNPNADVVRQLSDQQQNVVINADSGTVTAATSLTRGAFSVTAAAYTNSVPGASATNQPSPATTLYDIDTTNNALLIQSPQNNGTLMPVAPLGISGTISAINGFEITGTNSGATGTSIGGFAALQVTPTGSTTTSAPTLYNISLSPSATTQIGVASAIGTIGVPSGTQIVGLSAPPSTTAPTSTTSISVVYTANNTTYTLATFAFGTPGTLTSTNTISGLGTGETVYGADFRPRNAQLYVLTNAAVYTLSTAGQATKIATLSTTLTGQSFGVDFSPAADQIRVVSNTGSNYAIAVDGTTDANGNAITAGTVTTASNLNVATPSIVTLQYTANYTPYNPPGSTTPTITRAIVVDAATSSVYQVGPAGGAGGGVLIPIGGFTLTTTFTAGTGEGDIVGGDDGLGLAALVPSTSTTPNNTPTSTLYQVNPFNGAITAVGTIGTAGTTTSVNALAIQLK